MKEHLVKWKYLSSHTQHINKLHTLKTLWENRKHKCKTYSRKMSQECFYCKKSSCWVSCILTEHPVLMSAKQYVRNDTNKRFFLLFFLSFYLIDTMQKDRKPGERGEWKPEPESNPDCLSVCCALTRWATKELQKHVKLTKICCKLVL